MPPHWHVHNPPAKPLLAYDGDCSFCRRWVSRWQQMTLTSIDYQPYQSLLTRFPEIPEDDFAQGVKLIEPDGQVHSSAAAVFRTLHLANQKKWLWWLYLNLMFFAAISESLYNFISHHRGGLDRLDRLLLGKNTLRPTYFLTRDLFLRLLGVIYLIAFSQYYSQADGLIGSHGILPLSNFMTALHHYFDAHHAAFQGYWQYPTLFWLSSTDKTIHLLCILGIASSLALILGLARPLFLAAAWLLYLSLTIAGQTFFSFQWDALLLESGFIAIFLASLQLGPKISCQHRVSLIALWLQRWLLFRLMFLSGLVKLTWGDVTWKSWEVLRLHYETQPLPTWTSWYIDKAPEWFHWISLIFMWLAELIAPWLIFGPRKLRLRAFAIIVLLQLLIAATGNYGFFNLLTVVLCITLLDDSQLARLLPLPSGERAGVRASSPMPGTSEFQPTAIIYRRFSCFPKWITLPLASIILIITTTQIIDAFYGPAATPWSSPFEWLRETAAPLQSVNSYGLFRVMTRDRKEIIIEGSDDNEHWLEYQFKYKPGNPSAPPKFCTPLMPRLDWQMWFAALGDINHNPWLNNLLVRLLQARPEALALMGTNPFPNHPPQFIRAVIYQYRFTTAAEHAATGAWWHRDQEELYRQIIRQDQVQGFN